LKEYPVACSETKRTVARKVLHAVAPQWTGSSIPSFSRDVRGAFSCMIP
jgi:hypothetical protein